MSQPSTITRPPSITPTLYFTGDALQAAEFWTSIFPSSHVNSTTNYPNDPSTPIMISLTLMSRLASPLNLLLLNIPADQASRFPWKFNESFSFTVTVDTQEEVDEYWDKLVSDGGEERECCWCKDKFGMFWQIVPRKLAEVMGEGGEKASRAQEVMFKWKKADIAELERAIEGL
jgi:predicted 3-demethylubiquinone-9 3-methyltransferase (glyoxalase superfamily)